MTIDASDILSVTKSVTKEWTKQRKAEERGRRSRSFRQYVYSDRVNFTDVAAEILPGAYEHASGGKYTVSKRQLYYACREQFREKTDRAISYEYFAGTLLVQYMNRNTETESWKVTADPRGALRIPNAGRDVRIPCGTLAIDKHLLQAGRVTDPYDIDAEIATHWPSLAAKQRYQAVLYIEKEGFDPIIEEAKIAERFDVAILSCKGQSVVAARKLIDQVCCIGDGVPLLVVHDFDKAGFEISQRLTKVSDWAREHDRVTYEFQNDVRVIDLGLRFADVQQYDLADEEVEFKGHFARDSICTKQERAFLRSNRRVELNAFTSPEFIEWIENKLTKHGFAKRLIPNNDILNDAFRRALVVAHLNDAVHGVMDSAIEDAEGAKVPKTLRRQIAAKLKEHPETSWDKAIASIVQAGWMT